MSNVSPPLPLAEPTFSDKRSTVLDAPRLDLATRATELIRRVVRNNTFSAILDQCFYSGTTFMTTVLIARFAGATVLAAYALAFSVLVLVICANDSLVSLPFTFNIHRLPPEEQKRLTGSAIVHTLALGVLAGVGLAVFGFGLMFDPSQASTGLAMAALGCASPSIMLREFARKLAFAHLRFWQAVILDASLALSQLSLLAILGWFGWLTAPMAFIAIGLACGVIGGGALWRNRRNIAFNRSQIVADWMQHWRAGRWIGAALVTLMLQTTVLLWLVAGMLDKASAGMFAVCLTLLSLSNPVVMAIGAVFTSQASRAFHQQGLREVRRVTRNQISMALIAVGFMATLLVFGDDFIRLMFGEDFAKQTAVIYLLAFVSLAKALEIIAYNGLMVVNRSAVNFWVNSGVLALLVPVALALISLWGLFGAALAMLLISATAAISRWGLFLVALNASDPPAVLPPLVVE